MLEPSLTKPVGRFSRFLDHEEHPTGLEEPFHSAEEITIEGSDLVFMTSPTRLCVARTRLANPGIKVVDDSEFGGL